MSYASARRGYDIYNDDILLSSERNERKYDESASDIVIGHDDNIQCAMSLYERRRN